MAHIEWSGIRPGSKTVSVYNEALLVYLWDAEGTMFHSVTYGKNLMGSYASQLSTEQRWMIIHYIKEKQAANVSATPAPAKDSIKTGK